MLRDTVELGGKLLIAADTRISLPGCILIALLGSISHDSYSQDEVVDPPVLKLDRIMPSPAFIGQTRAPAASRSHYLVETVVGGLSWPWAIAFLPDNEVLITEYETGEMKILNSSRKLSAALSGLPEIDITHPGWTWAGLFDVILDPEFKNNETLYFAYTAPSGDAESPGIQRVAKAQLNRASMRLDSVDIILDGTAWKEMHFAPDGNLMISGASSGYEHDSGDEQDLTATNGKLLRIKKDGSPAAGNPFIDDPSSLAEIYSYGHRAISGIATHPDTEEIWLVEHGPRGGDEINIVRPGANYGWRVTSYGTYYNGEPVSEGATTMDSMEQPRYFWSPSIAPSGLMFYTGTMFPEWRGNLFVTALSGQHISRLVLDGNRIIGEERLLVERGQRIRDVRQGPDGSLFVLTNEERDAPKGTAELLRIYR
jgi:glucose/arabinose dehydrogenase